MASTDSSRPGDGAAPEREAGSTSRTSRSSSRTERASSRTESAGSRTGLASFTAASDADRAALKESGDASPARTSAPSSPGKPATRGRGPRRIRLTLARLDPFSVMKLSFLIALCIGIATIICTALLWGVVDGIGLWDKLDSLGRDLNNGKPLAFMQFFEFSKMVSYSVIVAFVNLVIITALGTLFAFLYNIVASLLGGLKMTFTDE